ncbi:hypothetical protein [Streptomyces cahuitamycinicus]|uniref:Uncharacterized protein n=1 Tax=Streptomyces cahuitamycinicus TaxID=2070367 RepID=A0A2N8TK45_9ACTN|nr:hypothetical protein [Streptomyces cahuitamycinicus]PNG19387.1 hypothetical protein C1J00_25930 [Streptomyces cahuitamycinicus]
MGSGAGGEQTLASSPSDKKRAAKYLEEELLPDTQAAARIAEGGGAVQPLYVAQAPPTSLLIKPDTGLKGFSGWALEHGLSDVLTVWHGQANRLMGRLRQEMNGLHGTKNILQSQDTAVGAQVAGVRLPSSFDGM